MIKKIGIRREEKNRWERRVPLTPEHIRDLTGKSGFEFVVQPFPKRAFPDEAYSASGAKVAEEIKDCDLVMGVKEIPIPVFRKNGMYMFFSHTIKGQPHNMAMLRKLRELKCTLIDYERIVDSKGRRLVFFGRYAGLAGMIDTLWALGQRLSKEGMETPFKQVKMTYEYRDLAEAKDAIGKIGREIEAKGLPKAILPLVIGFTGYGNVSRGAQEIFDLLPHKVVNPEDLAKVKTPEENTLYKTVFHEEHTVRPKDPSATFDQTEFFSHPERYCSTFRSHVDHLSVLVNCIFWSPDSPRLISKAQAAQIWGAGKTPKLKVVGDISCDILGGIEFTVKDTQPDFPVFVYDPSKDEATMGVEGRGPVVMAVDNLPCELPAEASQEFSTALIPFMPSLRAIRRDVPLEDSGLPDSLKRGVLLWNGEFPAEYAFMKKFLE